MSTKELPLTTGGYALIDAEDYAALPKANWYFTSRYVRTRHQKKNLYLHRVIMNPPIGAHVDHINGNALDNRRSNLRLCTHADNMANRKRHKNGKLPYRGISRWGNKWKAIVASKYVGLFATQELAAKAYDKAAIARWGEFARTNFPI